jgi:glycosyltransferase involved in cell wall biosynthesis
MISILITTYNKAPFIQDCLTSVLDQSSKNWEIIVVDDASTDGSDRILSSFSHNLIKYIRHEHRRGCSAAYKTALDHAQGIYCGILDGDDVLTPDAVEVILNAYSKHPELGYIYTQQITTNRFLEPISRGISRLPFKTFVEDDIHDQRCFHHWRTFRTNLRDNIEIFDIKVQQAVDCRMSYVFQSHVAGGFLNKVLYKHRRHPNSITSKSHTQRLAMHELANRYRNIPTFPVVALNVES